MCDKREEATITPEYTADLTTLVKKSAKIDEVVEVMRRGLLSRFAIREGLSRCFLENKKPYAADDLRRGAPVSVYAEPVDITAEPVFCICSDRVCIARGPKHSVTHECQRSCIDGKKSIRITGMRR